MIGSELWQKMFLEYLGLVGATEGVDYLDDPAQLALDCGASTEQAAEFKRIVDDARAKDSYRPR